MALVIGIVLAVLSILVVAYPFFQARWQEYLWDVDPDGAADSPDLNLDSIYDSIRTLQLERQLGHIPEGLYQEQLRAYRLQAAVALRDQARLEAKDEDWTLEEEVRIARAGLRGRGSNASICPNCGTPVPANTAWCGECDTNLDPRHHDTPAQSET